MWNSNKFYFEINREQSSRENQDINIANLA